MADEKSDRYEPAAIEPKWQKRWDEERTFRGVLKQFGYTLPEPKA